jgi:hypothetical protein
VPNKYWFYGLIIISSIMLIYTGYKKKNLRDLFSLFVFATGVSWYLEAIVLFILNAYAYKPKLFPDPWVENITGHLIANTALWSSTAILVMYFQFSIPLLCLVSVFFMSIEELFLKFDAYDHYWWKTEMTGIGVFLFLMAMKKWYSKLQENGHKLLRFITIGIIAWVLIKISTSVLTVIGKLIFKVNWYENIYRSSAIFDALLYDVFMASIFTIFVSVLKKPFWSIVPFVIIIAGDMLLNYLDILVFFNGWNLIYLTIFRALSIGLFILCEKYTLKPAGS